MALVTIFFALAGLHLYWGLGGFWPGTDGDTLRLRVVGTHTGPMFGFAASALVAGALAAAAAIVLARHYVTSIAPIGWVVTAGYVVLFAVFAGRGVLPYVSDVFSYARGTPFYDLNLRYYAPLCLLIAALLAADFLRAPVERAG
ncbi:MAG: DUF3995 domain-containing protein [Phycisphaerales bacterium]|nr:DUF3995 domain-containing protein [Hyphomonadaceae bacterium]